MLEEIFKLFPYRTEFTRMWSYMDKAKQKNIYLTDKIARKASCRRAILSYKNFQNISILLSTKKSLILTYILLLYLICIEDLTVTNIFLFFFINLIN